MELAAGTVKGRRRRRKGTLGAEGRRVEVARLLLERKSYREILEALRGLPAERRPRRLSLATISRDVQALRAEWAEARGKMASELVGEEVARLNALEQVWWPDAMDKDEKATDKVLAIQRQRAALLGLGLGGAGARGAVQVTAGAMATSGDGPLPAGMAGAQVKVLVEYVDDRRELG